MLAASFITPLMFGDDNSYIYVITWWIVEQKSLVDQKSGEFNAEKPKKKCQLKVWGVVIYNWIWTVDKWNIKRSILISV